jgi:hypothetical protein
MICENKAEGKRELCFHVGGNNNDRIILWVVRQVSAGADTSTHQRTDTRSRLASYFYSLWKVAFCTTKLGPKMSKVQRRSSVESLVKADTPTRKIPAHLIRPCAFHLPSPAFPRLVTFCLQQGTSDHTHTHATVPLRNRPRCLSRPLATMARRPLLL